MDIQALLAEGARVRDEARRSEGLGTAGAAAQVREEQTHAEARRLIYDAVCEKRASIGLSELPWDQVSGALGKYFAPRLHPQCNRIGPTSEAIESGAAAAAAACCDIRSVPYNRVFRDPKTHHQFAATGTVFLCRQRGQPHHCVPQKCRLVQANPEEPGTLTCPVSGFAMGSGIDDSGMFYRPHSDAHAELARDIADAAASTARQGRPEVRRRRAAVPSAPLAADDGSGETRRYQLQHTRHMAVEHLPAHRADVRALVQLVVVRTELRETMRQECAAMEARQLHELLAERRGPIDTLQCATIVANHMIGGLPSVMEVCAHDETRLARDDELHYLESCMFSLFHNIRRVSAPTRGGLGTAAPTHKDPNLKRLSLMLFYLMRDGLVGTRTYDDVTGRVRTALAPVAPTDQPLLAAVDPDADDDDEEVPPDADGDDGDGDGEDGEGAAARQDCFVFVPAHPGLRSYLPDLDVLAKIRVQGLAEETASLMRKRRRVSRYFTRMLCEPDPAQFCMAATITPLRPDLFM